MKRKSSGVTSDVALARLRSQHTNAQAQAAAGDTPSEEAAAVPRAQEYHLQQEAAPDLVPSSPSCHLTSDSGVAAGAADVAHDQQLELHAPLPVGAALPHPVEWPIHGSSRPHTPSQHTVASLGGTPCPGSPADGIPDCTALAELRLIAMQRQVLRPSGDSSPAQAALLLQCAGRAQHATPEPAQR